LRYLERVDLSLRAFRSDPGVPLGKMVYSPS
jgi:hypothetical protein